MSESRKQLTDNYRDSNDRFTKRSPPRNVNIDNYRSDQSRSPIRSIENRTFTTHRNRYRSPLKKIDKTRR